jgi:hypothetical protein
VCEQESKSVLARGQSWTNLGNRKLSDIKTTGYAKTDSGPMLNSRCSG